MECQLDSLRKCLKLDALRKALNTMPKTLDETYDRILSNLDEDYEEYALKIFQWLCFSKRPMRIDEMVEVLAVESTDDCRFSPEQRLPDPHDILTICSTLVSVATVATKDTSTQNPGAEELRLAHFSVKEYLISERLKKTSMHCYYIAPSSANFSIVKSCLAYLLHFESPSILTAEFDQEFPLIRYAAEFWPTHYKSIIDDADKEEVDILGCRLVDSKRACFLNWLRIFNPDSLWKSRRSDLKLETNSIPSPLYYMSLLDVTGVLKTLLNTGINVNIHGGEHGNALSAASYSGHERAVRLLLDKGANVNAKGGAYDNPLSAASSAGCEKIVRLLLGKGADVNATGRRCNTALSAASYTGHEMVVRLVLERGAEVNAQCRVFV